VSPQTSHGCRAGGKAFPYGCNLAQVAVGPVNQLRFRYRSDLQSPFVWLHGEFRVASQTPWVEEAYDLETTAGPFVPGSWVKALAGNLLRAGFPFLRTALVVEADFSIAGPVDRLKLCGLQADAARVRVNDVDLGWTWGPGWEVAVALKPGQPTVRLAMIPSTFNYFGPHHYYAGDRQVISPDQFTGRRNFADVSDAPANTLVPEWRFRPFRLPHVMALRLNGD